MFLFIVYTLLAITLYGIFYILTRDTLNPIGLSLSAFTFAFAVGGLNVGAFEFNVSYKTHIAVLITIIEITLVGWILLYTKQKTIQKKERCCVVVSPTFKQIAILITIVSALMIVYSIIKSKFDLYIYVNSNAFDKKSEIDIYANIGPVRYIASVFPYTALWMMYLILFDNKKKKVEIAFEILAIIFACIYTWFVLISRGTFLIILLGMVFLINKKYRFSLKIFISALLGLVVLAGILLALRLNIESVAFGGKSNAILNSTYNYIASCFMNLDLLLREESPLTGICAVWVSLSKMLGIYDETALINYTTIIFNARGFLYYFYHDLGFVGIIIYPTLIYLVIGWLYVGSRTDRPEYILMLAVLAKPIFVIWYSNYYFGIFSQDFPYILTAFALFLAYGKIKRVRLVWRH